MFKKVPFLAGGGASKEHGEKEDGQSLTTVLKTPEQRSSLTILVADCTQAMRQSIVDTFDANQTGQHVEKLVDVDEAIATPTDGAATDAEKISQEKLAKSLASRQQEVNAAAMQDLKAAALKYFDEWQSNVIQRIGEVINARDAADSQQQQEAWPSAQEEPSSTKASLEQDKSHYDENVQLAMQKLYPPIENTLTTLPEAQRALIVHSILLLLLSLEHYQAPSRILLLRLTTSLGLPIHLATSDENKIARGLLTAAENLNADNETKKRADDNQGSRKWQVGLAAVAGAALIGVTGGLAAPLLAAGVGSVMGGLGLGATAAAGYLGTLAGSSILVGGLFGAYGGRMTSQMMDQYAREVEDFAFVPVRSPSAVSKATNDSRRLRVAIGISGWLTNPKEVYEPWRVLGTDIESFALRFELESLMGLGNAITGMVRSFAWGYAKSEIIKRTVFASLTAGLWPLALLKVGRVIDNPFSVAHFRAVKAGEVLADALINKAQGERPVTLVGYSLGGKVIYTCLQKLAERKAFGLVESVVLVGTPASSSSADWRKIRSVVSGRVVNVYSSNDYILAFLYRSQSIQYGIAGLQAIEGVAGIENVDVSDIVSGHTSYRFLNGTILNRIGFEDVDAEELALEKAALKEQEAKEERDRAEDEQKESAKGAAGGEKDVSEDAVDALEKDIEQRNERSYVSFSWTMCHSRCFTNQIYAGRLGTRSTS
jgi:pimeloyl-ACP methyl ester carboxylesterase